MNLKLPKVRRYVAPAPIWKRLLAFVVDLLVIDFFIASPFRDIFAGILANDTFALLSANYEKLSLLFTVTVIMTILALLYFIILDWKIQQTVGKIIFNIYVKPEGKELRFWQIALSNISFIPFFPFIILWVIDPLYMLFSNNGQRLMQKISKTMVVEEQEMYNYM